MSFLSENIIAYNTLDIALKNIEASIKDVESSNVRYFFNEEENDKYLSDYVNSVREMRRSVASFNNLFEDLLMEIETTEQLKWEEDQKKAEEDYYSEVQNEEFNQ